MLEKFSSARIVMLVKEKYEKLDVIVSNAAANPSIEPIFESKESVLHKLWEINIKSSILILQEAAPHLQKGSSVDLISFLSGYQPVAPMAMYGVTKTALFGLTKALAAEMGPETRVNCVPPSFVPTNFADFVMRNPDIKKGLE